MKRSRSPQVEASFVSASVARTDGNASATIRSTSASVPGVRGRGPVGQERDQTLSAQRQLPLLYIPVEQVVGPLIGGHGRYFQGLRELSGGGVAEADRQRLPFFLQRVELLEAPLPAVERFVQLYQIHIVGRQPSQGCFERVAGGGARAALGGGGDPGPVGLPRPAQPGFGRAPARRGGGGG